MADVGTFVLAEEFRRSLLDSGLVAAETVERLADYLADRGPVITEYVPDLFAMEAAEEDAHDAEIILELVRDKLDNLEEHVEGAVDVVTELLGECVPERFLDDADRRHFTEELARVRALLVGEKSRPAQPPTASPTLRELPSVAAMGKLLRDNESGRRDLNPRPPEPHRE